MDLALVGSRRRERGGRRDPFANLTSPTMASVGGARLVNRRGYRRRVLGLDARCGSASPTFRPSIGQLVPAGRHVAKPRLEGPELKATANAFELLCMEEGRPVEGQPGIHACRTAQITSRSYSPSIGLNHAMTIARLSQPLKGRDYAVPEPGSIMRGVGRHSASNVEDVRCDHFNSLRVSRLDGRDA
jgi:hypothetical protein